MSSKGIWVSGTVKRTTDGAVLLALDEQAEDVWFPRSQIFDHSIEHGPELDDTALGEEVMLEVSEWIAEEKGIA